MQPVAENNEVLQVVTAKQISEEILHGLKTPNRVLEDAKQKGFPLPLRNISRKPLVWNRKEVINHYYPSESTTPVS